MTFSNWKHTYVFFVQFRVIRWFEILCIGPLNSWRLHFKELEFNIGIFFSTGWWGHCLFRSSLHSVFNWSGSAWRDFAILGKKTDKNKNNRLMDMHTSARATSSRSAASLFLDVSPPTSSRYVSKQCSGKSHVDDTDWSVVQILWQRKKTQEFARRTLSFLFSADSGSVQDMSSPPKEKVETKGGHPPAGIAPRDCCHSSQASHNAFVSAVP